MYSRRKKAHNIGDEMQSVDKCDAIQTSQVK